MAGGSSCPYEQDLQKLERFLPLLINLIFYTESVKTKSLKLQKRATDFKIRWSSPLSASCTMRVGGPKFYSLDNLWFELRMSLFLYGATLRERAYETLLTGWKYIFLFQFQRFNMWFPDSHSCTADLKESSTLFRKAAGVYKYLAEVILPPLKVHLPKDRLPEITSSLSTVMSLICLADVQVIHVLLACLATITEITTHLNRKLFSVFLTEVLSLIQRK
ncbi:putative BRO1 domain superfamily protein [Dioscorea sansibarensis]